MEAGNILNHPVYGNPTGSSRPARSGRITSIANQYPERQVMMGLRFSF